MTFFAVCSLAEGRSKPVPKTRNDCFHQSWPSEWAVHNQLNAVFHLTWVLGVGGFWALG